MSEVNDDGVLGNRLDTAPQPWLDDTRISNDAKRILIWLCQQVRPHEEATAVILSMLAMGESAQPTTLTKLERAEAALVLAEEAGYMVGDDQGLLWRLVWQRMDIPLIGRWRAASEQGPGGGRAGVN